MFEPWILFASAVYVILATALFIWRERVWMLVARALVVSQSRGSAAVLRRGGVGVVNTVVVGLLAIAVLQLSARWLRLDPNGFMQAAERTGQHPIAVAGGLALFILGMVAMAGSRRYVKPDSRRSQRVGRRPNRELLLTLGGVVVSVVGAILMTLALSADA
jgi:hypothetical protein